MTLPLWTIELSLTLGSWACAPHGLRSTSSALVALDTYGRDCVRAVVSHALLQRITPEMLDWWFERFPHIELRCAGLAPISGFRLWHPLNHVDLRLTSHSLSGQLGLAKGAEFVARERWRNTCQTIVARVCGRTADSLELDVFLGRSRLAHVREQFVRVGGGTLYTSTLHARRAFASTCRRSPGCGDVDGQLESGIRHWVRHTVERTGNLERILPEIHGCIRASN